MSLTVNLGSGAGGWECGLTELDIHPIGIELNADAAATAHTAGHDVIRADMATYPPEAFAGAEGLVASPPCTDFSKAGKRRGLNGTTGHLVWQPVRWASIIRPRWVALEQVPEVLPIWRMEAARLRDIGYRTWTGILDAADYGVPQNRRRAILIASLDHQPTHPTVTHCEGGRPAHDTLLGHEPALLPWVSMAEALGWDGTVHTGNSTKGGTREGLTRSTDQPSRTVDSASRQWKLFTGQTTETGDGFQPYERDIDRPAPTIVGNSRRGWRLRNGSQPHKKAYPLDGPAPTVCLGHDVSAWCWERPATTVQGTDRIAQPGHHDRQWNDAVPVTLDQLARLQDYPDDYPFVGNRTSVATQIGNAIPAGLARAIGLEATRGVRGALEVAA